MALRITIASMRSLAFAALACLCGCIATSGDPRPALNPTTNDDFTRGFASDTDIAQCAGADLSLLGLRACQCMMPYPVVDNMMKGGTHCASSVLSLAEAATDRGDLVATLALEPATVKAGAPFTVQVGIRNRASETRYGAFGDSVIDVKMTDAAGKSVDTDRFPCMGHNGVSMQFAFALAPGGAVHESLAKRAESNVQLRPDGLAECAAAPIVPLLPGRYTVTYVANLYRSGKATYEHLTARAFLDVVP